MKAKKMPQEKIELLPIHPRIVIESPLKGDGSLRTLQQNMEFARNVCRYAVKKGYVPFASHVYFPTFLSELEPDERALGISMGFEIAQAIEPDEIWFCSRIYEPEIFPQPKGTRSEHENILRDSIGCKYALKYWRDIQKYEYVLIKHLLFTQYGEFVREHDPS